jgi:hypothetical protein
MGSNQLVAKIRKDMHSTDTKNERAAASFRRIVSSNRALVGLDPRGTATLPNLDFFVLFEWFRQHLSADELKICSWAHGREGVGNDTETLV